MTKRIMIQGTMSGVGKSLMTAALCRIFSRDGFRTSPFKSQNMALNSYITPEGKEMGRAQVLQAQAAGKLPDVRMNPVLLKPTGDTGSQVILNGEILGNYSAAEYYRIKKQLVPEILKAYHSLAAENDILVIEGAGSPAEINLKQDDIVNMGLAELVDAPVILVGDIDPGGVFAQICGTLSLLEERERRRVFGCVINKFRGDSAILKPGLQMLEERTGIPVLGVVPYLSLRLDEEDSLARTLAQKQHRALLDLAVIRFPHLSNFTDFSALELHPSIGVRYVQDLRELGRPDLVILPGSKNTVSDLLWMRRNGLETGIRCLAESGMPVLGICGGYQMLGDWISDPEGAENRGEWSGIGLLPVRTVFSSKKVQTLTTARVCAGPFAGAELTAYQIHMGQTEKWTLSPFSILPDGSEDGAVLGNVFGTYLHGLFDSGVLTSSLADWLLRRRGLPAEQRTVQDYREYQEQQLDSLADTVRRSLDLETVYRVMETYAREGG